MALLCFMVQGWQEVHADITGAHGLAYSGGNLICIGGSFPIDPGSIFKANACTLTFPTTVYVPKTGQYRVKASSTSGAGEVAISTPVLIDAMIPVGNQSLAVSGVDTPLTATSPDVNVHYCYALIDENGNDYGWSSSGTHCAGGDPTPLPPTPPQPTSSCVINDANSLNVSLGTLERATLPTVPGAGTVKDVAIPVQCSGDASVTMSMALNYTPITVSGEQVVKTSANGIGVAVIYSNQPFASASTSSVTFPPGSSTLNLGFEAVRDPAVTIGSIPTGAFSASAVLVMTQQ